MADVLTFSPQPIRVVSTDFWSPLWLAADVLQYDFLDVEFGLVGLEAPGASPQISFGVGTALQRESDSNWFGVSSNTLTAVNTWVTLTLSGTFLRYVRWFNYPAGWGTQAAAEVFIRGMGRRRGEP